ncbi:hypothetical protein QE152_g11070 [Popillia japonica]|uniref:Uncharacterized protein n=1 Tax=Popillia japonica TaxID=7064 RepID=A0AAW1LRN8_POPJA
MSKCQKESFVRDVHIVLNEAIRTKLTVGKLILDQVTLTISSEGIQVTAPTIFKHQNTDREQKEENIDVLRKTFAVFVANIDDELSDRYLLEKIAIQERPKKPTSSADNMQVMGAERG